MAHENAVLKESLVNLEEQLEMAERKMDASMKIVEKVQQVCPIWTSTNTRKAYTNLQNKLESLVLWNSSGHMYLCKGQQIG
jgi:hypothetical protein